MVIFVLSCRLSGYDSAISIENIKEDDIDCLTAYGREMFQSIESNIKKKFSTALKRAIVGSYYNNSTDFRVEKGEKILLQNVVRYTGEKLRVNGYSYFSIEQANGSISEQQNVFYLEAKGKYIFIEKERGQKKSKPLASNESANIIDASVAAQVAVDVAANLHQQSNCVQGRPPPTIDNNRDSAAILRNTLVDRLNKLLNDSNLQIDEKAADDIRRCMQTISINLNYNGQGNDSVKSARVLCFCGNLYTLKWVQTKMRGYWKYFNWDRHIKEHLPKNVNRNGNIHLYFVKLFGFAIVFLPVCSSEYGFAR